ALCDEVVRSGVVDERPVDSQVVMPLLGEAHAAQRYEYEREAPAKHVESESSTRLRALRMRDFAQYAAARPDDLDWMGELERPARDRRHSRVPAPVPTGRPGRTAFGRCPRAHLAPVGVPPSVAASGDARAA